MFDWEVESGELESAIDLFRESWDRMWSSHRKELLTILVEMSETDWPHGVETALDEEVTSYNRLVTKVGGWHRLEQVEMFRDNSDRRLLERLITKFKADGVKLRNEEMVSAAWQRETTISLELSPYLLFLGVQKEEIGIELMENASIMHRLLECVE